MPPLYPEERPACTENRPQTLDGILLRVTLALSKLKRAKTLAPQ